MPASPVAATIPEGAVPRGDRTLRVAGGDTMNAVQPREIRTGEISGEMIDENGPLPGGDLYGERVPGAVPDELAARVRVLRRARRDARTRASRVRRVLLAPTAPASAGEMYAPQPRGPRRH